MVTISAMTPQGTSCSDYNPHEPLAGTGKSARRLLLLEQNTSWGRDIADAGVLQDPTLISSLGNMGVTTLLIRTPGRHDVNPASRTTFLYDAASKDLTTFPTTCPTTLRKLLSEPDTLANFATPVSHPLLLVCTHGKRDVCCATKGRPVANAAAKDFPSGWVWESSHISGHRFAPVALLLPAGRTYGRLTPLEANKVLEAASHGRIYPKGLRGRLDLTAEEEIAEIGVIRHLAAAGEQVVEGQLEVSGNKVTSADGRRFQVVLDTVEVPIMAGCEKPETKKLRPVVTDIIELT